MMMNSEPISSICWLSGIVELVCALAVDRNSVYSVVKNLGAQMFAPSRRMTAMVSEKSHRISVAASNGLGKPKIS